MTVLTTLACLALILPGPADVASAACPGTAAGPDPARTIRVPADVPTVQGAINAAVDGDTVLVAPGTYFGNLVLSKTITLASHYHITGDPSCIGETILDGSRGLFVISVAGSVGPATTIVGFTIQNGGAGDGVATVGGGFNLLSNRITNTGDGVDCEDCRIVARGNVFEGNRDDGFDSDGSSAVTLENNIFRNNDDDGIEVRLHSYDGPTLTFVIRNNIISGNDEDGIQLIDQSGPSARTFLIEGNLILNNRMAGLGMMGGGNTVENFSGFAIPDPIHLVNNTFVGNDHGLVGGANVTARNNIFFGATRFGVKNVTASSTVAHSLFWGNGIAHDTTSNVDPSTSIFENPMLDAEFRLRPFSPAIDVGDNATCPPTDLSGETRPQDGSGDGVPVCDLGAYEALPPPDAASPVTTATPSPGPNGNGWNKTDVTVALAATDAGGSGVKEIVFALAGAQGGSGLVSPSGGSVTISAEGETTLTYFARDHAGNAEPARTLTVKIDRTPPEVVAVVSPEPNAHGWNKTDVTVTFVASDSLSGVGSSSGPVTVATEGAGQVVSGTAVDQAGNSAGADVTVNLDRTLPAIAGLPPADCMLWPPNHQLVQVATVTATDTLAGLAGAMAVTGASNEPESGIGAGKRAPDVVIGSDGTVSLRAERSGRGTGRIYTLTATASDLAGNVVVETATCVVPHDKRKTLQRKGNLIEMMGGGDDHGLVGRANVTARNRVKTANPAAEPTTGPTVAHSLLWETGIAYAAPPRPDMTPPTTTATRSPGPDADGWNSTDVTVALTATGAGGPGVKEIVFSVAGDQVDGGLVSGDSASILISAEGETTLTYFARDHAGNEETAQTLTVRIDRTRPARGGGEPGAQRAGVGTTPR